MKTFFEEAFKRKAEAKKAGNKALAQVWKIIINSAYGFWGIRVEDKDSVLIQEKGACDIHDYIHRGKFLNYTEIGKYGRHKVYHACTLEAADTLRSTSHLQGNPLSDRWTYI